MKSRNRSFNHTVLNVIDLAERLGKSFDELEEKRVAAQAVVDELENEYSALTLEYDRIDRKAGPEWEVLLEVLSDELARNEDAIAEPNNLLEEIELKIQDMEYAVQDATGNLSDAAEEFSSQWE